VEGEGDLEKKTEKECDRETLPLSLLRREADDKKEGTAEKLSDTETIEVAEPKAEGVRTALSLALGEMENVSLPEFKGVDVLVYSGEEEGVGEVRVVRVAHTEADAEEDAEGDDEECAESLALGEMENVSLPEFKGVDVLVYSGEEEGVGEVRVVRVAHTEADAEEDAEGDDEECAESEGESVPVPQSLPRADEDGERV
jgi:hypothetical protein